MAKDLVAHLRSQAGRNPYDRGLSDLVGELSTRSPGVGTQWAADATEEARRALTRAPAGNDQQHP